MASRQNSYSVIDTTKATPKSYGEIVSWHGGLDNAIAAARARGEGSAIVHCLSLLSSDENDEQVDASRDFYSLVETDMKGFLLKF